MRMIEDLFYGNICPCEKHLTRGSEYSQLLDKAVKNEEKLSALLSPQQKEVYEKVKDCMTDMNNILEKEAFIDGFRLGVKLIAESVYDKSGDIWYRTKHILREQVITCSLFLCQWKNLYCINQRMPNLILRWFYVKNSV